MVITRNWLETHATANRVGWTKAQAEAIGVRWPLAHGWKRAMCGRVIPDDRAREFERLGIERRTKLAQQAVQNDLTWG